MKLNLPSDITSPQDLKSLILEIRGYARWFSQADIKQQVSAGQPEVQPVISPAASGLINQSAEGQPLSGQKLDELIKTLEDLSAAAPRVNLTVAAPPSVETKKTLTAWCRQNIQTDILVEVHFNSTILGGLVVQYGSHVYDWSFKRQILAARERFPEVLRRV